MNLLSFLLRASKGVVALSILAGVVSGVSGVGLIALINAALGDDALSHRELAWGFLALGLVAALTCMLTQVAMVRLAQGSVANLCTHLCRKILAVPLRQFEELDPSGLVAVLTEDIVIVADALVGIPLICINLPIVLVCLAYVGWLSPPVLISGLVFAAPAIFSDRALIAAGVRQLTRGRAEQDTLVGHFRALIDGFRELKIHRPRREAFLTGALQSSAETVRDRSISGLTWFAAASGWSQLAYFGFIGFVLFVLPGFYHLSRQTLSGAVLVVLYIMSPLQAILTWIPILGRARVSLLKIDALGLSLQGRGAEHFPSAASGARAFRSSLELSGVTFAYPDGGGRQGFHLGPIDLALRPEEMVFVAGGNGSGKTTLVKLITGLYAPDTGTIRLDGPPVTPEELDEYRQLFSVIFADGHLFQTLLGLEDAGLDARARDGLARLELDGLVRVEAGAFSTTELSQGQRRRLALLTACLEERPILVLDEWASHQDPQFKRVFYLELLPELKAGGKTLVVISHDEDFFHVADRVIRLDAGQFQHSDGRYNVLQDNYL
ncbi:MAG: cyclic peptide export ABC transporter [Planctomycetaceae bacterium]|nr:cyclic peptide export ABC transporter [Planctomycetaceae bacterium]